MPALGSHHFTEPAVMADPQSSILRLGPFQHARPSLDSDNGFGIETEHPLRLGYLGRIVKYVAHDVSPFSRRDDSQAH